jgi:hybrid cluster-associated redox disulfide protein
MLSTNNLTNANAPYVLNKSNILLNVSQESPRAAELLAEYGLHCLSCFFSEFDTLEMGAQVHGMSQAEVTDMITEINAQLKKEFLEENKALK